MEPTTSNNVINAIKETRELFNKLKSNLPREETKKIRKKLYKKETVYNFLKEKEDSLTDKQKNVLKNIGWYLKKLKKDLEKLQKYEHNITYDLKYLFDEEEEDYYEPTEIKSAFDDSYILYESKGDKDAKLSLEDYFNKIRSYLNNMINNHKARGEWKIQLSMKINFVSSKDNNESRRMHTKSDNIEIMSGTEADDVINELF